MLCLPNARYKLLFPEGGQECVLASTKVLLFTKHCVECVPNPPITQHCYRSIYIVFIYSRIALKEPAPNDREGKQGLIITRRLVLQRDNQETLEKGPMDLSAEARNTQILHVFISFLFPELVT